MNKKQENNIWYELYRPKDISGIILPKRLKSRFEGGLDTNLLLSGTAGTGKTTLAKILAKGRSILFLNASLDNSIDNVRNEIMNFGSTGSLINRDKKKVIILDEADKLSLAAQEALKGIIESLHKNVIFIFTSNHPEKLSDPIRKSRLNEIEFRFTDEEQDEMIRGYVLRIRNVLKHNKRTISKDALKYVVKTMFPDFRNIYNALQAIHSSTEDGYEITLDDVKVAKSKSVENIDFYKFLCSEPTNAQIYQQVKLKFLNKEAQTLASLGTDFIKYLMENKHEEKVGMTAMITHKYNFEVQTVPDKFITLLACCSQLSQVFKRP